MGAWSLPCGWRLLFFALLAVAEVHGSSGAKAADALPPRLFSAEVRTLRRIAAEIGISSWNLSANPCGSGGLACDCSFNNKTICHVTDIFLNGHNFSAQLPPDFADLPNLIQLDLSRNLFHGAVPDQWARMRLQGLSLMGNRLSGPFPMVLTKITTLTNMSIEGNEFHGLIPPEIGQLAQMEKLIISTNEFTGPLPAALSLLTNLTDLVLRNCSISGSLPPYIGDMENLKHLDLSFNKLTGKIPDSFTSMEV
ncbi:hypothetical protein ACQ4PT_070176 [Festuca glaucescens]